MDSGHDALRERMSARPEVSLRLQSHQRPTDAPGRPKADDVEPARDGSADFEEAAGLPMAATERTATIHPISTLAPEILM